MSASSQVLFFFAKLTEMKADSGNFLELGNKFTVTTTNILLMMVAILLLVLILEGAEKPKNVRVVTTKREKDADKTN